MFATYEALLRRLEEIVIDGTRDKVFHAHAARFLVTEHGLSWVDVLSPADQRDNARTQYYAQLIAYGGVPARPRDFGHVLATALVDAPMFELAEAAVLVNRAALTPEEAAALGNFVRRQFAARAR